MNATYKTVFKRRKGYALATILVLMAVMLAGVGSLVAVSSYESHIARSQQEGTVAYYAAESGMEEALWRLKGNSTYLAAVSAGTLNVTYSITNAPRTGQGYAIAMVSTSAGYATITSTGYSDNGQFRAQRKIETTVFQGPTSPPTQENALMLGGSLSVTNGSGNLNVSGGSLYVGGSISFNNTNVSMGGSASQRYIRASGSYSANNSNINGNPTIQASNRLPAPSPATPPGFDFTYYAANATATYTPAQFQTLITSNSNPVLNGVVYVSGSVTMNNSWARNKNITVNGMLVVNGSFTVNGNISGLNITVNDPGTGKSGIFVKGSFTNSSGNYNINGILYAGGAMQFNNSQTFNMNGAIVAGGAVSINTGLNLSLTYNAARVNASFGYGGTQPLDIQHWEEEY